MTLAAYYLIMKSQYLTNGKHCYIYLFLDGIDETTGTKNLDQAVHDIGKFPAAQYIFTAYCLIHHKPAPFPELMKRFMSPFKYAELQAEKRNMWSCQPSSSNWWLLSPPTSVIFGVQVALIRLITCLKCIIDSFFFLSLSLVVLYLISVASVCWSVSVGSLVVWVFCTSNWMKLANCSGWRHAEAPLARFHPYKKNHWSHNPN